MKKTILLFGLSILLFSCSEDEPAVVAEAPSEVVPANKVMLLKVDLLTNTFEGGKELLFPEEEDFTISYDYVQPGDFGNIVLNYAELNQKIFDGSIVWMGLGERSYPAELDAVEDFTMLEEGMEMPDLSVFQTIEFDPTYSYYPAEIDYQSIWNAIDNLEEVQAYRESNPDAKVHLFLYSPSVGVGDPAEWDWYVILKN